MINIHTLFCVMGRSASGKTSLVREYCKETGKSFVQSYTTRPKREDDDDAMPDHIFISDDQVSKYSKEMIAYTKIGDYKYFATVSQIMSNDFYIIDPIGLIALHKLINQYHLELELIPIYITCDKQTMADRAFARRQDMNAWYKRYYDENQQFASYERGISKNPGNYFVVNNNGFFAKALKDFCSIVERVEVI